MSIFVLQAQLTSLCAHQQKSQNVLLPKKKIELLPSSWPLPSNKLILTNLFCQHISQITNPNRSIGTRHSNCGSSRNFAINVKSGLLFVANVKDGDLLLPTSLISLVATCLCCMTAISDKFFQIFFCVSRLLTREQLIRNQIEVSLSSRSRHKIYKPLSIIS